jgi:hypothetical protein
MAGRGWPLEFRGSLLPKFRWEVIRFAATILFLIMPFRVCSYQERGKLPVSYQEFAAQAHRHNVTIIEFNNILVAC